MAEKLTGNKLINVSNNYGYLYGIHNIHEELKALLQCRGDDKFYVLLMHYLCIKLLCRNLGRILEEGSRFFKAELDQEQNHKLVEDIAKRYIFKVIKRQSMEIAMFVLPFQCLDKGKRWKTFQS